MQLSVIECFLIALFISQVLEVYRHGTIFEEFRDKLEIGFYLDPDRFVVRLVQCMFCFGVWVSGAAVLGFLLRPSLLSLEISLPGGRVLGFDWAANLIYFLVTTGALTRLANIIHDLVRPLSRTPNSKAREENIEIRKRT